MNHSKNASPDILVMDASFLQWNRSNLKSNIVSIWEGKCRKHCFRISSANALPVNGHPTVIAVDGRATFTANVNRPLVTPHLEYTFLFYKNVNFKHLRHEVMFLMAPNLVGHVYPTPFFNCWQFSEESTFYLSPEMLGRWSRWGKPVVSQLVCHPMHDGWLFSSL